MSTALFFGGEGEVRRRGQAPRVQVQGLALPPTKGIADLKYIPVFPCPALTFSCQKGQLQTCQTAQYLAKIKQ
jgi:hypothetical protein